MRKQELSVLKSDSFCSFWSVMTETRVHLFLQAGFYDQEKPLAGTESRSHRVEATLPAQNRVWGG